MNAVAPGYIATENTRPIREDEKRNESILARIPEGRWGMPEDIAGSCVFLVLQGGRLPQRHHHERRRRLALALSGIPR